MSQLLINNYLKQLDIIKRASGSQRETIVREAFKDLLKAWGKQQGLIFLAEYPLKTATKTNIAVDGALLHELRMPPAAWRHKLGNRCALDWVLGQYKEKKPKDPTIRAQFDSYRFADYKDKVIDLLARVTTVSVETMKVVDAMKALSR